MERENQNPGEDEGDELEAEIMRADRPFAAASHGTTPAEELAGLSLDDALSRERPDARTTEGTVALVDGGAPDDEKDLVAEGSIEQDDYVSPEEAALSIRDEAPGATDHEDT